MNILLKHIVYKLKQGSKMNLKTLQLALVFCFLITCSICAGTSHTPKQMTPPKIKKTGGVAFTCPAAKWSGLQSDFYYHFTLAHITTQKPKIVKLVRKAIENFVTTVPLKSNGHRSLSWIPPGTKGASSLFITGEAADFKIDLHNHLMQDPIISIYLSPYRAAHVDVNGNFSKKLYDAFTVDQIIERETK